MFVNNIGIIYMARANDDKVLCFGPFVYKQLIEIHDLSKDKQYRG